MSEVDDSSRRARPWLHAIAGFAVGVALAVVGGLAMVRRVSEEPAPVAPPGVPAPAPGEPAPAAAPVPAPAAAARPPVARAGGTLVLERSSFPASGPVRVTLDLPEASADGDPRPVRMISQDERTLEIHGALESDRTAATIEVDPGYLQPGTYLVEVKTTERGAMPLRRYFIIVR
jgi:hypothetical protein